MRASWVGVTVPARIISSFLSLPSSSSLILLACFFFYVFYDSFFFFFFLSFLCVGVQQLAEIKGETKEEMDG